MIDYAESNQGEEVRGLGCSDCGSSDALVSYNDGSRTNCFSCGKNRFYKAGKVITVRKKTVSKAKEMVVGGEFIDLRGDEFINRNIDRDVAEKFGVKVVKKNGIVDEVVFPYFNASQDYVAQKTRVRDFPGKGIWKGAPNEAKTLFGSQLFQGGGKRITLVEGEYDALATYQLFGKKYPVVSVRDGADKTGSCVAREIKNNYDFLCSFDEIILCFDADESGIASAKRAAEMLPIGRTKIMTMRKHNDPNEYLRANDSASFIQEYWNARAVTPDQIVRGTELRDRIIKKLKERREKSKVRFPWDGLNDMLYGIRTGEMVTIISGTGSGKSLFVAEQMYNILMNTDEKIGVMMLEESVEMANVRLASLHAGKPYHLPDTEWTDEEMEKVLSETVELVDENGGSRVISYDHFGSSGIDELLHRIDYMVRAEGCKYLFLDHISIVVSDQRHGDERRALDEIASKLRQKIQEHDVSLFIVSHLRRTNTKPHEEGGTTSLADIRGTQAIAQLSDAVIGLERNGQADCDIERNTTTVRVLKNRLAGITGIGCKLFYDHSTGRLTEVFDSDDIDILDDDKPLFDSTPSGAAVASERPDKVADEIETTIDSTLKDPVELINNEINFEEGDELPWQT
jgi:twinkle protein